MTALGTPPGYTKGTPMDTNISDLVWNPVLSPEMAEIFGPILVIAVVFGVVIGLIELLKIWLFPESPEGHSSHRYYNLYMCGCPKCGAGVNFGSFLCEECANYGCKRDS